MTGVKQNGPIAFLAILGLLACSMPVFAADSSPHQKLQNCLKKAADLPDIGEADALRWFKQGGGEEARFCHASAQFSRNEFLEAAKEFSAIAALHDLKDPRHAAELHARSGLSFVRAGDMKRAENEYEISLKLEPNDPETWLDRAIERAQAERFWDAVSDADHALKIMPEMVEAYKLRGQAWVKLGNTKNAQADFAWAEQIENAEQGKAQK